MMNCWTTITPPKRTSMYPSYAIISPGMQSPEYCTGQTIDETFVICLFRGLVVFCTCHLGRNTLERPRGRRIGILQYAGRLVRGCTTYTGVFRNNVDHPDPQHILNALG